MAAARGAPGARARFAAQAGGRLAAGVARRASTGALAARWMRSVRLLPTGDACALGRSGALQGAEIRGETMEEDCCVREGSTYVKWRPLKSPPRGRGPTNPRRAPHCAPRHEAPHLAAMATLQLPACSPRGQPTSRWVCRAVGGVAWDRRRVHHQAQPAGGNTSTNEYSGPPSRAAPTAAARATARCQRNLAARAPWCGPRPGGDEGAPGAQARRMVVGQHGVGGQVRQVEQPRRRMRAAAWAWLPKRAATRRQQRGERRLGPGRGQAAFAAGAPPSRPPPRPRNVAPQSLRPCWATHCTVPTQSPRYCCCRSSPATYVP